MGKLCKENQVILFKNIKSDSSCRDEKILDLKTSECGCIVFKRDRGGRLLRPRVFEPMVAIKSASS